MRHFYRFRSNTDMEHAHILVRAQTFCSTNSRFNSPFISFPVGFRGSGAGANTNITGTLKAAETLGEEDAEVASVDNGAVPQHHDRGRLFAQCGMRDADHAGVDDGGMFVERILDFDEVDVFAAADQHVLGAIEDVTETLGVETGDIAGAQPAIDEQIAVACGSCQ